MGYQISDDMLRKVQLVQLEILIEYDRICQANNLPYQLFAGTLLGAIRHKGFIPWDDDIDVVMLRDDYEKFSDICMAQLDSKYFLQNYKTDPGFFRQFSRMRRNGTRYIQSGYSDIEMHHGIFIDIFPLDNVIPGSIIEILRCKLLYLLSRVNRLRNKEISTTSSILKRTRSKLIRTTNRIVAKTVYDRLETKIMKAFNRKSTGYLNHLTNGTTPQRFKRFLMEDKDFNNIEEKEFEGFRFPISRNHHSLLTNMYGDYMKYPPVENRKPHHGIINVEINSNVEIVFKN